MTRTIRVLGSNDTIIPPTSVPSHGYAARISSRGFGTFQVDPRDYPEASVKASFLKELEAGCRQTDARLGYGWESVEGAIEQAIKDSQVLGGSCSLPQSRVRPSRCLVKDSTSRT